MDGLCLWCFEALLLRLLLVQSMLLERPGRVDWLVYHGGTWSPHERYWEGEREGGGRKGSTQ